MFFVRQSSTAFQPPLRNRTADHKLVVEFSGYGEKTLLAKFAKLTKL